MATIVDTIMTTYQELFTVRLDHVAYETSFQVGPDTIITSSILQDLTIQPDTVTRELFKNNSIGYTCGNNMIICFLRKNSSGPYITLPSLGTIRLLIKNKNDFIKKTDVKAAGSDKVYQFTNKSKTGTASNRFITVNSTGVSDDDLMLASTVKAEEPCFGVIDIFINITDNFYRILDGNTLESPGFIILFNKK
ncbi:MAG TPA: hypothetical protein VGH64_08180 [Puia sp.]